MEPECRNEAALPCHEQAPTHAEWRWIIWVAYAGSRISGILDVGRRGQRRIQGCDNETAVFDQNVTRRRLQVLLGVSNKVLPGIARAEAAE